MRLLRTGPAVLSSKISLTHQHATLRRHVTHLGERRNHQPTALENNTSSSRSKTATTGSTEPRLSPPLDSTCESYPHHYAAFFPPHPIKLSLSGPIPGSSLNNPQLCRDGTPRIHVGWLLKSLDYRTCNAGHLSCSGFSTLIPSHCTSLLCSCVFPDLFRLLWHLRIAIPAETAGSRRCRNKENWGEHREEIERLYINEGWRLSEVVDHRRPRRGFDAA